MTCVEQRINIMASKRFIGFITESTYELNVQNVLVEIDTGNFSGLFFEKKAACLPLPVYPSPAGLRLTKGNEQTAVKSG
ncbi:MAG: hypothetical protein COB88_09175 [Flavobacteriales bacterium]|nr:MAG: hypothetical protein COB88_09175 [Flavobacteriales bacterium]